MLTDALAATRPPTATRRGLAAACLLFPTTALLAPATGASPTAPGAGEAREALSDARAARERADSQLADLRRQMETLDGRISQLSASAEAITEDLARSREALRATAVEAFIEHGRESELLQLLAANELADASDRATLLGAGAGAAATDVADYQRLRDDTSPELVKLADRRGQLERRVREADDAALQARAAEADAERAADAADAAARQAEVARLAALASSSTATPDPAESGRALDLSAVQVAPPPDLPVPPPGGPSEEQWAAMRRCESGGNYRAVSRSGRYRGAYQFDQRTWEAIGGRGDPAAASPQEQDVRAKLLYVSRGSRPWPVCGRQLHR